ncbi:hypothetical protein AB0M43_36550 [Longispora sp. NPDC051575]|uniref:hypothetical protein n=1 Tax=Longispora sp. NPDC051575 TaxID=3154943 RepID=UPI00342AE7B2
MGDLLGPPDAPVLPEVGVPANFIHGMPLEAVVTMAANESTERAAAAGGGIHPETVEQLHEDVYRMARAYGTTSPLHLLIEARRSRELACDLLERTRRPNQTRELYSVAGRLCALMASASFDLGVWSSAVEQARAATVYAEVIEDPELGAWARGTQALIAYWMDQPRRAADYVAAALVYAPAGAATARLHAIGSRAFSHLGDVGRTGSSLQAADLALEQATGELELHEQIGGEFGWDLARHAACAGTALLQVGQFGPAARRTQQALDLLDASNTETPHRAHIDLALAQLGSGELDATVSELTTVWEIPPDQRRTTVTGRLLALNRALSAAQWRDVGQADQLRDRIEVFTTEGRRALELPAAG